MRNPDEKKPAIGTNRAKKHYDSGANLLLIPFGDNLD
jgi:hypothetical protein